MTESTTHVTEPVWFESDRRMSLGVMLPNAEGSHFGGLPRFADMVDMSRAAREVGFEGIWFADHFVFEKAETGELFGVWEAFTSMSGVAAAVPDVQIGAFVACTGFRNPGVVAKMTETLDEISGGRFVLGLGAGWNEPEYKQFGFPFDYRVSRFEDAISIIHPLLREGKADYQGRFFQANGAVNRPRGPRETGAPILVGSNGERMLGLVAQYADAWNTVWHSDTAPVIPQLEKVDAACRAVGRDPSTLIRTVGGVFGLEGAQDTRPHVFTGTPDEMAARLAEFRDLGFNHYIVALDPCTPETLRRFGDVIAKLDAWQ